jgi:uncharacterized OB-fold protein
MKADSESSGELIEVAATWDLSFRYAAGEVGSRYVRELRDNARIMATRCPTCGRTYLPPQAYCERCFIAIKDQWFELDTRATLVAFTIVTEAFEGLRAPPYVLGYFKVGEASTHVPHILEGIDLSDLGAARARIRVGMPVELVFKREREGSAHDFFFRPLEPQSG